MTIVKYNSRDEMVVAVKRAIAARVNCIVRHMDEWYDVFNGKPSNKLYLAPADRVRIYNK